MIQKIKDLLVRYREVILYLIFGGLTTVVDFGLSSLLYFFWEDVISANLFLVHGVDVLGWIAAVLFAFITNRIWVFQSRKTGFLPIMGELFSFAGGRVVTFLLQEGVVLLFFNLMKMNYYLVRIIAAVLVIILNYIISKLFVFRKKKDEK